MPKSKKTQRKTEDFKKVKLKVGKRKAPPSNATDTSFTSRAIVLGQQSISADKSALRTNSRNLTLRDLLTQLRHYSAATRRDAVAGLADFVSLHGDALQSELGPIVDGTVRLMIDSEPSVRRQALRLLGDILPTVPAPDLAPFVPLAVMFACSAMTHIMDDIRADAVKFLDLLADVAPASLALFSARILPSFFSMLETSTPASDGKRAEINARTALLTQGSRLSIMRSCHKYLSVYTVRAAETADPLWFMGLGRAMPPATSSLYFSPATPAPYAALNLFGESAARGGLGADDSAQPAGSMADSSAAMQLQCIAAMKRLFPFLQATWIESSTGFATSQLPADHSLDLCTLVLKILQTLWRAAYADAIPHSDGILPGFLRQCMVCFPFGRGYSGDADVEAALLSLNLKVCELAALIQLGSGPRNEEHTAIMRRVVRFVLETMGTKAKKPRNELLPNARVHHEQFTELIPVVWHLARGSSQKDAGRLLAAVINYASICPVASPSKTLCIRFLLQIIQAQWVRAPIPGALDLTSPELTERTANWVLDLPKLLWQLRDRNLDASMAAAETLRTAVQRTRLLDATAVDALQVSLIPLFCVDVPGKGPVHGPFRRYPPALQRTLLEVVSSCPGRSSRLAQAVRASLSNTAPARQIQIIARLITA
ncbi:rRNA processing protein [Coemansia sp. RSA 552]|nr:rRNA processing protein [Coemansia sp. RSA 552]